MKYKLAAAALLASTAIASAADLPARTYTKAPVAPVAVYNWGGLYVGAHVGYGWSHTASDQYSIATGTYVGSGSADRDSFLGGGQIGYNLMLSPNWLLGIEADITGADFSGSTAVVNPPINSNTSAKLDYFGTVRGRLGYAADNVLFYGTGGLLWVHSNSERSILNTRTGAAGTAGFESTNTGWVAGGGIEWGFLPNWSAKAEYLYGEVSGSGDYVFAPPLAASSRHIDTRLELHTFKVGVNYRFGWGGPVVAKY